jgi:hypothetical protein
MSTPHVLQGNNIDDDDDVQGQAPCPACGATVESVAHLMFECPVTTTARAHM